MKIQKSLSIFIACALSANIYATEYWFSRGVDGETASRNWSDLNNWSTVATTGDAWNTSKSTVVGGVSADNFDIVNFGINSGLNGTSTTPTSINLDQNAYVGRLNILNVSNLPTSISSTNSSVLNFKAAPLATKDTNSSPVVFYKADAGNFTINTDINVTGSAGTADSGATYVNLWTKLNVAAGTLTLNGANFTTSINPLSSGCGDIRLYTGLASSSATQAAIYINSKISTSAQIVFGSSGGTGSITGKLVLGGSESNAHTGTFIVENNVKLYLNKTNGAQAITGNRLQLLSGSINLMGSNQISDTTQLAFAQANSNSTDIPLVNLNGNSETVKTIRMECASWLSKAVYLKPTIDFGVNSTEQEFRFNNFEFGTIVASDSTTKGLILSKSNLVFKNYNIGEDTVLADVQLSTKIVSTTIAELEGMTYMDLLVFDGYDMSKYEIKEIANGAQWEYSLQLIPEPSTVASILGGLVLALAVWRRRSAK